MPLMIVNHQLKMNKDRAILGNEKPDIEESRLKNDNFPTTENPKALCRCILKRNI